MRVSNRKATIISEASHQQHLTVLVTHHSLAQKPGQPRKISLRRRTGGRTAAEHNVEGESMQVSGQKDGEEEAHRDR